MFTATYYRVIHTLNIQTGQPGKSPYADGCPS